MENDLPPYDLYIKHKSIFNSIAEYIDVLDCLYALNKIKYEDTIKVIYYVR